MKTKTHGLRGRPDFLLLVLTLALVGFGLVMVFSASSSVALVAKGDSLYFTIRQLIWAVIGIGLMFVIMNIPYAKFKTGYLLYFVPVLIMLVLVLFIGKELNGARSWFLIGSFGIQPTEFAKLGLILYLGSLIAKKGDNFRDFKKGLLPVFIIVAVVCGLIMRQPDLGACIIIAGFALIIIVAGGANLKQLLYSGIIIAAIVAAWASVMLLSTEDGTHSWQYRIDRFTAFMDPTADETGSTYHLSRSLQALGHGGFTGVGFGHSVQKLDYLPYPYSDFIFAIIAEEFGFIGSMFFLLFYLFFLWRGLIVALRCSDNYGTIVGVGIVGMFAVQAVINIGGVTGAMPLTGVTLPFISHGGSSLLVSLAAMGVLLSISRDSQTSSSSAKPGQTRGRSHIKAV
ncbi:putative lipid II flippase FtsW [Paenibacillus sp. GCM10027626]|uniref:putative lipid II flippase FtsW n=1 Tax=Paenibacillus sp. GCM10027626 TaxID=3273411 RepID=UPI00364579E7